MNVRTYMVDKRTHMVTLHPHTYQHNNTFAYLASLAQERIGLIDKQHNSIGRQTLVSTAEHTRQFLYTIVYKRGNMGTYLNPPYYLKMCVVKTGHIGA